MSQARTEGGESDARLGIWSIGARGSIATCLAYGVWGLQLGLVEPLGMITEREPLRSIGMRAIDRIELGGHEIVPGPLTRSAAELQRHRILPRELLAACSAQAAALDARIRPGVMDLADLGRGNVDPGVTRLGGGDLREAVERLAADIVNFREDQRLERVVAVNLASTEPFCEESEAWGSLAAFEEAIDRGDDLPSSCLYAYAAMRAGAPFVNFTPSRGSGIGALRELAREMGLPHCGNDGKTGETLLKTTLAPMFAARALRVLSWQGYNMLGNRDGASLADPMRREAKCLSKDESLRQILGDESVHTHVGIDYVPSLNDWKTAMDYVHFEGFLGARMSLQFTWSGSDSALAAPLVIDLVRLADLAAARGEVGEMAHTACFFKAPLAGGTAEFAAQFAALMDYAVRSGAKS